MEYFDVVDENGIPTGETVERTEAHRLGYRHRTAHVWIVRHHHGIVQILLQKRCKDKDSFPECYDISSAGHIPAGVDYIPSAIRELEEELSLIVAPEELIDCGLKRLTIKENFHGEAFIDRQVSRVFLLWRDLEEEEFLVQKEEIDCVLWVDFALCKEAVRNNSIPNCIDLEELEMLEEHLQ